MRNIHGRFLAKKSLLILGTTVIRSACVAGGHLVYPTPTALYLRKVFQCSDIDASSRHIGGHAAENLKAWLHVFTDEIGHLRGTEVLVGFEDKAAQPTLFGDYGRVECIESSNFTSAARGVGI